MSSSVTLDQPRLRKASATPLPLVSDTSRSADQPPIRTTTWMDLFIRAHSARHPRESGDPAKKEKLGSRIRGNDEEELHSTAPTRWISHSRLMWVFASTRRRTS